MNMADDTVLVWKHVSMRKEPSFLAVPFSGSELQRRKSINQIDFETWHVIVMLWFSNHLKSSILWFSNHLI